MSWRHSSRVSSGWRGKSGRGFRNSLGVAGRVLGRFGIAEARHLEGHGQQQHTPNGNGHETLAQELIERAQATHRARCRGRGNETSIMPSRPGLPWRGSPNIALHGQTCMTI